MLARHPGRSSHGLESEWLIPTSSGIPQELGGLYESGPNWGPFALRDGNLVGGLERIVNPLDPPWEVLYIAHGTHSFAARLHKCFPESQLCEGCFHLPNYQAKAILKRCILSV